MKKPEISFRVFGGSGPLSIYFYPGPYGDAIESMDENGVYWLSQTGALLGLEFDDVDEKSDHQILELPEGTKIEIDVKKGKVSVKTHSKRISNKTRQVTSIIH